MPDLNLCLRIEADALCAALVRIADALGARAVPSAPPPPNPVPPIPALPTQAPTPPAPVSVVPTAAAMPHTPTPEPAAAAAAAAPASSVPAAPTTPPRAYELPELQVAASALCDAGGRDALLALLGQFGVRAMSELPQEQYGAFATALRRLGAKI